MKINFQKVFESVRPFQPDLNLFQFEKYWHWYEEVHHYQYPRLAMSDLFDQWIKECKTGKPLGHIIGQWAFFQDLFFVNASTLIPRPETEIMVEEVLKKIQKPSTLLEIGTGSGAIILSVMLHSLYPLNCLATDISPDALKLCRKNIHAKKHRLTQHHIKLLQTDRTVGIEQNFYDFVLCNPPYIPENYSGVTKQVTSFEPALALYLPQQTYHAWFLELLEGITSVLKPGGMAFIEGHEDFLLSMKEQFYQANAKNISQIKIIQDFNRRDRFLTFLKAVAIDH